MQTIKDILNSFWDDVKEEGFISDSHMTKLFIELMDREESLNNDKAKCGENDG